MGGGLLLWKQYLGCFRYKLNIGDPIESNLWCFRPPAKGGGEEGFTFHVLKIV